MSAISYETDLKLHTGIPGHQTSCFVFWQNHVPFTLGIFQRIAQIPLSSTEYYQAHCLWTALVMSLSNMKVNELPIPFNFPFKLWLQFSSYVTKQVGKLCWSIQSHYLIATRQIMLKHPVTRRWNDHWIMLKQPVTLLVIS